MTEDERTDSGFYVAITAETDEDYLVADIVFEGDQVASAIRRDGAWTLTVYAPEGSRERSVPLVGMLDALREVTKRLGAR